MMPRSSSTASNASNNNMNANVDNSNTYPYGSRRGEGGERERRSQAGPSHMTLEEQIIRQRYQQFNAGGPGPGGGDGPPGIYPGRDHPPMNEYGGHGHPGLANQLTMSHSGRAGLHPSLGGSQFNPNMYPHLGVAGTSSASAAGMTQQGTPQQPGMGEHLMYGAAAEASGASGSMPGSLSQAEVEEEMLLNLLIARRQRAAAMRSEGVPQQPLGPDGQPTSWTEDYMRLRRESNPAAMEQGGNPYAAGLSNSLYQGGDSSSHRSQVRMGQMPNANVPGGSPGQQYMPESSRLRQRGSIAGASQAMWVGNNSATAAAMHPHAHTPRNEPNYSQGPDMISNTQLGIDVLERPDMRMMPGMYDARMPDQPPMGYSQQYSMGGQRYAHTNEQYGYGKRPLEHGAKAASKLRQYAESKGIESQPTKKKRTKKKPADMPRRPLSAYNLFFSEERERILKEMEAKSGADNEKGDEGKSEKGEETESDTGGKQETDETGKPKALLRPLLPADKKRRPHRKTHGKISFQLLAQKVGQRWKALPDDRRKYYQDLAKEDMIRQKRAMEEYYQKRSAAVSSVSEAIGES